jgi:hypothetical protein
VEIERKENMFIYKIIKILPDLEIVLDDHIKDYDELLPFVFMGDVTRFVTLNLQKISLSGELKKIMNEFESAFIDNDPDVVNLIVLGFFENLIDESTAKNQILREAGPVTLKTYRYTQL